MILLVTVSCGEKNPIGSSPSPVSPIIITPMLPVTTKTINPPSISEPQPISKEEAVLSIAYIKNGNIWFTQGNEPANPLMDSGGVVRLALSSDSKTIAYEKRVDDYHSELWSVNTDSKEQHLLISVDEFNNFEREKWLENAKSLVPYHFDFIPNTHILAFNTRMTFEEPGLALFDDLRLVNTDTNEKLTLLPSGQGGEFVYSPDGQQITVITPTSISLINTDGSNRRQMLSYSMVSTYSEYIYYALPIWSADSKSLRVAIPPADPLGIPREATTLWSIPTDGNSASQIGSIMAAPFGGIENAFSPDFSHVIYTSESNASGQIQLDLHLANADGTNDTILMSNPFIAFYGWAPDSQHFIVSAGEPALVQLGDLNKNFHPIAEDTKSIGNVTWVSDNEILYVKGGDGIWELHLGTLDGNSIIIDSIQGSPPPYDFTYK